MPRASQLRLIIDAFRKALLFERTGGSTAEGLERLDERQRAMPSRRDFVRAAGLTLAAASRPGVALAQAASAPRIAIVGGGLAGLTCADRLQSKGYACTVYEAGSRLGGRCFSNRSLVSGMAVENGGELVDTAHKTILAYANQFGLKLESYVKKRGEERFYFLGGNWTEADVIDQFRAVVKRMQPDLRAISSAASFYDHNSADVDLDNTPLAEYFATRCEGMPLLEALLNEAYLAEYGLETGQQSALNFVGFMRLNKRSKFEPFGASDERYHLADGNDGIVSGIAARLRGPILTGAALTRLARGGSGRYLLYFNGSAVPETADALVLAVPFTTLRNVELDPSLGFSSDKLRAIQALGYGTNAKTMVAFSGRPWSDMHGSSGGVYSDLPSLQASWETNRFRSGSHGVITDYASGDRGMHLSVGALQQQVDDFLTDFDTVLPGTKALAVRRGGDYVAHLEHWPSNPLSRGSYTCYLPGQFTTVAGLEGEAVGLVKFAGEHTDSFYSGFQGYMEGACLSGIRAADEILADIKSRVL